MCWFLTIAVPQTHFFVLESGLAASRALQFTFQSSSPTARVFSDGMSCAEVTHGGCSCSIYSAPPEPAKVESDLRRQHQRLVKKGWSQSKIDRALKAKAESGARPGVPNQAADAFNSLVAGLVGELGTVELFAHFYRGNQYEEGVGSPDYARISLQKFLEGGFPPDTIVSVCRAAG